jgi:hypothetical protein
MSTEALTDYLRSEIPAPELSALLDEHLHNMVEWIAQSGQPWSAEDVSTYHHIRRLRDLIGAMQVEPVTAIAS